MSLSLSDFNRLVHLHGATLYRVACRMMSDRHGAEDVVQETFRSVWRSRENFEEGRGDRAWLMSILRRRVIDRWRKKTQPGNLTDHEYSERIVIDQDPFEQEFCDEVQIGLNQLSPNLREALLLVVVGELTHQEVADSLEVPLGTILSRVSRAKKRLREFLATNNSIEE
ncbi:MAG: RNA polymerase sigma factor [Pirellulales bacterium]